MALAPKRGPGRPRKTDKMQVASIHLAIDASLRDALAVAATANRRSIAGETMVAIERYLGDLGLWPPTTKTTPRPSGRQEG